MAKWEYCRLEWVTGSIRDSQDEQASAALPVSIVSHEQDPGKATVVSGHVLFLRTGEQRTVHSFRQTVTELGLHGWELVSHTTTRLSDRHNLDRDVLMFKRHIRESHSGSDQG